jgi:hypothetical protein
MMQTTAAFTTLSVPTPMVLLYIDSVMIKYMKELHYGVFNNQSCAKSDFLLSIGVAQMKRAPIPFMEHKYFLFANFLVLIISHINMMLIVMFESPTRLHNGDSSQNKKLSKMLSLQDFAHHKIVKLHEITTYYLKTCVPWSVYELMEWFICG